jgi:hypothetical protein
MCAAAAAWWRRLPSPSAEPPAGRPRAPAAWRWRRRGCLHSFNLAAILRMQASGLLAGLHC